MQQRRSAGLWLGVLAAGVMALSAAGEESLPLADSHWFEARTAAFHTYSCGSTQAVEKLVARLEQFHRAYAALAGAQAVASPPIVVMAFPDQAALGQFLPRYKGKPANFAGFFTRSSAENLIVLSLDRQEGGGLRTILHEYAHLLLRRNEFIWPLWLDEGMADVYSTFQVAGDHTIQIGRVIESYREYLAQETWMPLPRLFAVNHRSPEYNERDRQGVFYAESWLLTQYLMCGAGRKYQASFGNMTRLLRQGQRPEQAFRNSFRISPAQMEAELHAYLKAGEFPSESLSVGVSLLSPQPLALRKLSPVETLFHLGDELMRLDRLDEAERYFAAAKKLAPASSLGYVGLGLLAAERGEHQAALEQLGQALARGSQSFLAHFVYASEKFRQAAGDRPEIKRLEPATAAEIRTEVKHAIALMPQFGPGHYLLGMVELAQGENLGAAQVQLAAALQLEPENPVYALTLAQAQLMAHAPEAARRTLAPWCLPTTRPRIRLRAQELLKEANAQAQASLPAKESSSKTGLEAAKP